MARGERPVAPGGEVAGAEAERSEAVGDGDAGEGGEVAERTDAEPLEGGNEAAAGVAIADAQAPVEQRDRQRREEAALAPRGDHPGRAGTVAAAGGGCARSGEGAEAGRGAGQPGGTGDRAPGSDENVLASRSPERAQAVEREEGLARALALDLGPDSLEPAEHALPLGRRPARVGRDEGQPRAAAERLGDRHPRPDPEGLRRSADLPDGLLASRLGSQSRRLCQHLPVITDRREQREAGDEGGSYEHAGVDATGHEHMFAHRIGRFKGHPRPAIGATLALLASIAVISGCGSGDSPPSSETTGGDEATADADPGDLAVIEGWSRTLSDGDVEGAAGYFAIPSTAENGGLRIEIRSDDDAITFNDSLPCGAEVIAAETDGDVTTATFELSDRPGGDCGSGAGGEAATAFRIEDGEIVDWRRVEVPGGTAPPPPAGGQGEPI